MASASQKKQETIINNKLGLAQREVGQPHTINLSLFIIADQFQCEGSGSNIEGGS